MDGITFEKLRDIESRFAEVEAQMSDPAVAQDTPAYQKLAREAKDEDFIIVFGTESMVTVDSYRQAFRDVRARA